MGYVGIKFNRIPCVLACWPIFRNCYWLDYIRFDPPLPPTVSDTLVQSQFVLTSH
jgi:hypothetical protein